MVQSLTGSHQVATLGELDAVLAMRVNGANSFWIARAGGSWPVLAVLVNAVGAFVEYFPAEGDAGFASQRRAAPISREAVRFSISKHPADDLFIQPDAVVAWEDAVAAAREFFQTGTLPGCLAWERL